MLARGTPGAYHHDQPDRRGGSPRRKCVGRRRVLSYLTAPSGVGAIVEHLELPSRPAKRAPAQGAAQSPLDWAGLLRRSFALDIFACARFVRLANISASVRAGSFELPAIIFSGS